MFTLVCDPTLANAVAILGNDLWSYAAPFVGGLMCIQVYSDYEAQKAGFQAAGISFCNFYNMIMGGMKQAFSTAVGMAGATDAPYVNVAC